ncbi:D-arabinono-1,4-lactone oxidase [Cohnella suwonensis]|uniref:D-arabinono-1,4-lactone oxidase n=1 Tax=Cohnella suwonensis TaxID=696072 RepID=A0ABW0M253_9BACL
MGIRVTWKNWSGVVNASPQRVEYPENVDQAVAIVRKAAEEKRYVRIVGSGHSCTPLAASDQVLVSLDRMQGIVRIDREERTAVVWAGTKLKALGHLLHNEGLAQENLGDIDVQSIAGAISTGTHGTGTQLGNLATQVIGLTIVNGRGKVLECSETSHPDLFKALQISLGVMGIIVQVKLRLQPSYVMAFESKKMTLDEILQNLEALRQNNRHFGFFWFPYTRMCQVKLWNVTDQPAEEHKIRDFINDRLFENTFFGLLSELCRMFPSVSGAMSKLTASSIPVMRKVNYSHRLLTGDRLVKFNEMEYSVPAEAMADVIREIGEAKMKEKFDIHFPIECRYVARDSIWLSPAYERDSAFIAVHTYRGMPYERYFQAMEEIFLKYDGRPHWGKMHNLKSGELSKRYPMWHEFGEARKKMDPDGLFLSPYMKALLVGEEI